MASTLTNTYKLEQIYEGSVALLFSFIFERKNRSTMEVFTPCVLGWAGWGRGGWLAFYHNFLGSFSELSGLPFHGQNGAVCILYQTQTIIDALHNT